MPARAFSQKEKELCCLGKLCLRPSMAWIQATFDLIVQRPSENADSTQDVSEAFTSLRVKDLYYASSLSKTGLRHRPVTYEVSSLGGSDVSILTPNLCRIDLPVRLTFVVRLFGIRRTKQRHAAGLFDVFHTN